MKSLSCMDMGTNCSFVATGKTNNEVKKKMMMHARKEHSDLIKSMSKDKLKMMDRQMNKMIAAI